MLRSVNSKYRYSSCSHCFHDCIRSDSKSGIPTGLGVAFSLVFSLPWLTTISLLDVTDKHRRWRATPSSLRGRLNVWHTIITREERPLVLKVQIKQLFKFFKTLVPMMRVGEKELNPSTSFLKQVNEDPFLWTGIQLLDSLLTNTWKCLAHARTFCLVKVLTVFLPSLPTGKLFHETQLLSTPPFFC